VDKAQVVERRRVARPDGDGEHGRSVTATCPPNRPQTPCSSRIRLSGRATPIGHERPPQSPSASTRTETAGGANKRLTYDKQNPSSRAGVGLLPCASATADTRPDAAPLTRLATSSQ
jgi:hypothetical protein